MIYRERLHVPWWWVPIAVLFIASLAVAVFAYVPPLVAGIFTGIATLVTALALLSYDLTTVSVADGALAAGRNRVGAEWIAGAEPLTGDDARAALGPGADHRDFLFTRPYIGDLVRITIDDPADPHPSWLVSTRRPEEFAAAIEQMRQPA